VKKEVRTMKRSQILPRIVISVLMMLTPALLVNTLGSSAMAGGKSKQEKKEAKKKSGSASHQRQGEVSQRVTPESKATPSQEQRALDSETLKNIQAQDEKSATSF
jgi:hypothetical protein